MAEAQPPVGWVGEPQPREVWVVAVEHPGSIVRGAWAREPWQYEFLRRARGLAAGTWEPKEHDDLLTQATENPTLQGLREWREALHRGDPTITVDVECAGPHLVCVGFCRVRDLSAVCVRLRGEAGVTLWGAELPAVVEWVYEMLSDPEIPKWFHNGQAFDIPYLEYQGFEVAGYVGDTLLLQRYMFPEMPADLQSCAIFYCGVPAWKQLASDINTDEKGDDK